MAAACYCASNAAIASATHLCHDYLRDHHKVAATADSSDTRL